jgi:hypothetical protein
MVQLKEVAFQKSREKLFVLARRMRLGKLMLRFSQIRGTGLWVMLKTAYIKRTMLPRILDASPIVLSRGGLEVHMLLNHPRVLEGAWCIYSFLFHLKDKCHVVIHDDGSLDDDDNAILNHLFPGIQIVRRKEADAHIGMRLMEHKLSNCESLRRAFVLGLKLFDPFYYSKSDYYVLLDSDILTYRYPQKLVECWKKRKPFFSEDNGYRMCIDRDEFERLSGAPYSKNCNSGLIGISKPMMNFDLVEKWLESRSFWQVLFAKAYHYTEQTIYALLMARAEGVSLGGGYDISSMDIDAKSTVTGHYCGGGYWSSIFYWHGLPYLVRKLSNAGAFLGR